MIKALTKSAVSATILSLCLLAGYVYILEIASIQQIVLIALLFVQGVILNVLCARYSILGAKSQLPLILFIVIAVLLLPNLAMRDLVLGFVWLAAFFLAFESRDDEQLPKNYIIFFGILLGVAQTIEHASVLLFLPVIILFVQTGKRSAKSFLMSFVYFLMVVLCYIGILFVMEIPEKIYDLVPELTFDYGVFNSIVIRLFFPLLLVNLGVHFFKLNTYSFRYPNKTIILNYTLALQLLVAFLLVITTAQLEFLIYFVHPAAVLLSFAYAYNAQKLFVNAAFASVICVAVVSLVAYKLLYL